MYNFLLKIHFYYETGRILLYAKTFGLGDTEFLADEKLSFPNFSLNQGSLLLIGAVHKNNYFKSVTGFMGEAAYIQMSPEFLPDPTLLWISEMLPQATQYKGINTDLFFNVFDKKNNTFKTSGFHNKNVSLTGNYTPIYSEDKNKTGIKFNSESGFTIGSMDFRGSPFVTSHVYYFDIEYEEPLPDKHPILFKNTPGTSGFVGFYLVKDRSIGNKRKLLIEAQSANELLKWESDPTFTEKKKQEFLAGIVVSPKKTAKAVLYLSLIHI